MASQGEGFFQGVTDAVKQLQVDAFNSFESQVSKLLDLTAQGDAARFEQAVDAVFLKVQAATDRSLAKWQEYCEANCFHAPEPSEEKEEALQGDETIASSLPEPVDPAKEEELEAELVSLRSRVSSVKCIFEPKKNSSVSLQVRREKSRLQNELVTLEAWLNAKREKVNATAVAANHLTESNLSFIQAEIARASTKLRERMKQLEEASEINKTPYARPIEDATSSKAALAKLLREAL